MITIYVHWRDLLHLFVDPGVMATWKGAMRILYETLRFEWELVGSIARLHSHSLLPR
jgi:hypothetical protein